VAFIAKPTLPENGRRNFAFYQAPAPKHCCFTKCHTKIPQKQKKSIMATVILPDTSFLTILID
jgi:hypothetical protein